jgi:hypothetical protein
MNSDSAHLGLTPIPSAGRPVPTNDANKMKDARSFRTGQTVWVLGLKDILKTLDDDGKLDGLPFMPEMLSFCGLSFRVACLPNRTCVEGAGICDFDDVVFLDGLRCDGSAHDGCQRRCLLFWRKAWLSDKQPSGATYDPADAAEAVLKTKTGERYFCQSTELAGASTGKQEENPGFGTRLAQDLHDLQRGNISFLEFSRHMSQKASNRLMRLAGAGPDHAPVGNRRKTETLSLGLQPGDWVEVKSRKQIEATLDFSGKNKGLLFTPPMLPYCGKRYRVADRLQKMILEETGKMIQLKDTVVLEGVTCEAWGCQRSNLQFWREIWLKRIES